jgi:hypothetical protein
MENKKYIKIDIKKGRRAYILHRLFHPKQHAAEDMYNFIEEMGEKSDLNQEEVFQITGITKNKAKLITLEEFIRRAHTERVVKEKIRQQDYEKSISDYTGVNGLDVEGS